MRIALVIQKLAGIRGGAERVVIELGAALAERGHEVTLVSFEPSQDPPAFDIAALQHVNLFPLGLGAVLRRVGGGPSGLGSVERTVSSSANIEFVDRAKWTATHGVFARRLSSWLTKHPHDVAVGFLPPAISAVAHAVGRLDGDAPRTVASTHSQPCEDFGDSSRWDQNPVARSRNLIALGAVDAVTVLQPEFVDQLPVDARRNAVVMPNVVVPPQARVANPARRPGRIIGVGRLAEVKNYGVLIGAFARLTQDLADIDLVIYGEGPERPLLEALVAELGLVGRVELPGVIDDLSAVYAEATVLAHPARFEGFGLSVAEAILHGVPVVAWSDCSGVNRLVEAEVSGLLVDRGEDDIESFAAGIRQLLSEPLPDSERHSAADRLADRLAPTAIYDRWEQLLAGGEPLTNESAEDSSS